MTRAADSSIAIAAILADHEAHDEAERALSETEVTIGHVAAETYGVLTRMPPPLRLDAKTAAAIIHARLPSARVALGADGYSSSLETLARARVSGGATCDGLIALTAREHDLMIVSRDLRAARIYRALEVHFQLLAG